MDPETGANRLRKCVSVEASSKVVRKPQSGPERLTRLAAYALVLTSCMLKRIYVCMNTHELAVHTYKSEHICHTFAYVTTYTPPLAHTLHTQHNTHTSTHRSSSWRCGWQRSWPMPISLPPCALPCLSTTPLLPSWATTVGEGQCLRMSICNVCV